MNFFHTLPFIFVFVLACLQTSFGSPLCHVFTALVTSSVHEEHRPRVAKTIGYLQETYSVFLKKLSTGAKTDSEIRVIVQTVKALSRMPSVGDNRVDVMRENVDMVCKLLYYKTLQYRVHKPPSLNTPSTGPFDELEREINFIDPSRCPVNEDQVELDRMQTDFLFDVIFAVAKTITTPDCELLGVVCDSFLHLSNLLNDVNILRFGEKAAMITSHINDASVFRMEAKCVVERAGFQAHTSTNYTVEDIEQNGLSTEYIKMATEQAYRRASMVSKVTNYLCAYDPLSWYLSTSSNGLRFFTTRMVSELASLGKEKMPSIGYFAIMHTMNVVNCLLQYLCIAISTFSSPVYRLIGLNTHANELAASRVYLGGKMSNFPPESKSTIYGRQAIGALTASAYYRETSVIHTISSNQLNVFQQPFLSSIVMEHFSKCSEELRVAQLSGCDCRSLFNSFVFDGSLVAMMKPAVSDYENVKNTIERTVLKQFNKAIL